jgi:hypothetical protein
MAIVALGRFAIAKSRPLADATIDFEVQSKRSPKEWGSEENREAETSFNRLLGRVVVGVGAVFGLISAVQLLYRLLS